MERSSGSPDVKDRAHRRPCRHPALRSGRRTPPRDSRKQRATCTQADSTACLHGTFVAGILSAKRNGSAPAICPDCTLLVRPIFSEATPGPEHMPSATPTELAAAIIECIDAGARVINLSLALAQPVHQSRTPFGRCAQSGGQAGRDRGWRRPAIRGPSAVRLSPAIRGSSRSWPATFAADR